MSVLRIVRGLVALEWGLVLLTLASTWIELDSLPESLREFVHDDDEKLPSTLSVLAGVAALAVHLTASAGLWRLAPWARPTYAASSLALLLSGLFFGPIVLSPVSGVLASASSYTGGALLAVLYLPSLVSAPPIPVGSSAPEARRGLPWLGGIGIALGAGFAVVGVLATLAMGALAFFMVTQEEAWKTAEEAAEGKSDSECLALTLTRPEHRWLPPWWQDSSFFATCLDRAKATDGLCAGVPALEDEGHASWPAERCSGNESPARCEDLMGTLQVHCGARSEP